MGQKVPLYDANDILGVLNAEAELRFAIGDALANNARPGDGSEYDRRCSRLQNELRIAKQTAFHNSRANMIESSVLLA